MATDDDEAFHVLLRDVEPGLRRALVAAYGPEAGREAAAEALAWAWEHRDRMATVSNQAGYLWRVAQSSSRRRRRAHDFEVPFGEVSDPAGASASPAEWDLDLVAALRRLTLHQRVAVVLVDAYGYRLAEAAAALDCSVSSVRNHLARGRQSLRTALEGNA